MRSLSRRQVVLLPVSLPLGLAACGGGGPPPQTQFPPLRFGYLTPLPLNVAAVDVEDQAPMGPGDVGALSPVTPAAALAQMARERLQAAGSSGRAVFVIQDASIVRAPDGLSGNLAVRLDVLAGGSPAAFAEARVSRQLTGDVGPPRAAAYELTRRMMDDMNVEFEYQVKRSLRDWLVSAGGAPGAVQAQDLGPPGAPSARQPGASPGGRTPAPAPSPPPSPSPDAAPYPLAPAPGL